MTISGPLSHVIVALVVTTAIVATLGFLLVILAIAEWLLDRLAKKFRLITQFSLFLLYRVRHKSLKQLAIDNEYLRDRAGKLDGELFEARRELGAVKDSAAHTAVRLEEAQCLLCNVLTDISTHKDDYIGLARIYIRQVYPPREPKENA